MAENTDEAHLDNPTINQSENPPGEIIPAADTETINPNQETENMEVHKHPHHVTHKKKFGEYLLEFFMLFLAVFLGFVAENVREDITESSRAKEYAKSFMGDLKVDTSELHGAVNNWQFMQLSIDSLFSISQSIRNKTEAPGKFYYYSRFMGNVWTVDWSRSTINQLVQSGNLRYIKNKALLDKINRYYADQNTITLRNQDEDQIRFKLIELRDKILDSRYYAKFAPLLIDSEIRGHIPSPIIDSLIKQNLPLQTKAPEYLDEYISLMLEKKYRPTIFVYGRMIKTAEEIMQLLNKEYHLEDE